MQGKLLTDQRISWMKKINRLIFELFIYLILLEIGLRIGGVIFLSLQERRNNVSLKQKGTYRIMCLGESTTAIGGKHSYPSQLEEILNERNIGMRFSVINKGVPGTNTSTILFQLEDNLNKYRPDMVITMMGINDRGNILPYENISPPRILSFLREYRVYKLVSLLWLYSANKLNELREENCLLTDNPLSIKFNKEEAGLRQAIEPNHHSDTAYVELGRLYRQQGKFSQAEEALKKAVELNHQSDTAYLVLGRLYEAQGKFSQAEEALKKAVELNPQSDKAYVELGWLYRQQGKFSQAEEALKKTIELNPQSDKAYAALSALYEEMGKPGLTKEYDRKAKGLRLEYYNPSTVDNYHKLKEILDKRDIRLICVQYPIRSLEPLRKIFQSNKESIIFVDNEKTFKDALKKASYKEYFTDMFGGDFGHCTPKGNRLLAENIANVILNLKKRLISVFL